jgi:hypothetical protein
MSATRLPIDTEQVSRELAESSSERQKEIANTVIRTISAGPPEHKRNIPNLLEMKGVLREESDERERPGTTALRESRKRDERKNEEMLERLRSDE